MRVLWRMRPALAMPAAASRPPFRSHDDLMHDDYRAYLQELFAGLGPVTLRPMFGGHGLYHAGVMIGLVMDEALYLKADADSVADFRTAGGEAFVYRGRPRTITLSYWSPPADALESAQAMLPWARLALAAALRKAARRVSSGSSRPPEARGRGRGKAKE